MIYRNDARWVDQTLNWLIGEVIEVHAAELEIHVWGTSSHHEGAAFVRDFVNWVW